MRDLALALVIFGSIPFILRRPFIGLLMWVWLSIMNPHRLTWGFAYDMPFAQIVALTTLAGLVFQARHLYKVELNSVVMGLIVFAMWVCVSPLFSYYDHGELDLWLRVIKILVMVLVTFLVVGNRRELHLLTLVLTCSVAFFGVKGGLFTLATGGGYRVWGPAMSFIADNNSLACAIVMAVPLLRYLQLQSEQRWMRWAWGLAMLLCVAAAIGSQSRGALVGLVAMALFFWAKGGNKLLIGVISLVLVGVILSFVPESWTERMSTIQSGSDDSARGRINAWWMAWNLALSRFPIGGGFNIYTDDLFARFAPVADDVHAAHSIYFQVLGEHGFMGLAIFLFIFWRTWVYGSRVIRKARGRDDLKWAADLASMCQVSLIGYFVGGAFLSLSYYDFPYYVVAITVVTHGLVMRSLKDVRKPADAPMPSKAAYAERGRRP